MDLTPYLDTVRTDLGRAAEASGEEARLLAERLAYALDPSMRLALMTALSDAAAEVTDELPGLSVEVRLAGSEPRFAVSLADNDDVDVTEDDRGEEYAADRADAEPDDREIVDEDDGAMTRVSLRLPERLKARAEQAAAVEGVSLNTWLTDAIRGRLSADAGGPGGPTPGWPFGPNHPLTRLAAMQPDDFAVLGDQLRRRGDQWRREAESWGREDRARDRDRQRAERDDRRDQRRRGRRPGRTISGWVE